MKLSKWVVSVALCAGMSGIASATPITWTDMIDFNPDRYIAPNSPASYTHDIRDDGYRPLLDSIVSYSLNVNLYDDADQQLDVAVLDVPGCWVTRCSSTYRARNTAGGHWPVMPNSRSPAFTM